jgi:Imidazolonepropionase and related amidohydrolases
MAEFADIFCEKAIFELEDSRRYLEAAKTLGLGLKIHADEIEALGGAGLAASVGAVSAEHLLKGKRRKTSPLWPPPASSPSVFPSQPSFSKNHTPTPAA